MVDAVFQVAAAGAEDSGLVTRPVRLDQKKFIGECLAGPNYDKTAGLGLVDVASEGFILLLKDQNIILHRGPQDMLVHLVRA